jgi:two-component system NtrC family sensor kinase
MTGPSSSPAVAGLPEQARLYRVLCALVVCITATDPFASQRALGLRVAVHATWGLGMGAAALVVARLNRREERVLRLMVSAVSVAAVSGQCWLRGNVSDSLHPVLLLMTIGNVFVQRDAVRATVVMSAISALSHVALLVASGADARTVGRWSCVQAVAVFFASYGSVFYCRFRDAELRHEREARQAGERLAVSEQARAVAEKLAVTGRLAAGVAHEVNNPLAYIKANLLFLRAHLGPDAVPSMAKELDQVCVETLEGVERIRQIVADLKLFSRDTGDATEPCSLAEAVEEAVRLTSVRLHSLARVTSHVPTSLPHVLANHRRLVQVLVNLLLNAADAVEEVRNERPPEVTVNASVGEGLLRLHVEDNGPGLPRGAEARMFEAFFTTKAPGKGTGLGLALSREYVERYGGRLLASERPGGGARMTIEFPLEATRPIGLVNELDRESTVNDLPLRLVDRYAC